MLASPGCWAGGGMMPMRLDRAEVADRAGEMDRATLDYLCNAFEPAFLASMAQAADRKKTTPARRPDQENSDG